MFEALVITLREGVEAALVLAIAAGLLRRQGQSGRIPALLAGAGGALLASVGLAVIATRIVWNQEIVEGFAMLVGAAFVLTLTWWMWRAAPRMKQEIEHGLARGSGGGAWGVALFGFVMVVREGFETAVFLAAAEFNSGGLMLWAGAGIGLALAVAFGVLFARGTLKVPLKPFFSLTTAVLLLVAFQLLLGGLHELSEGRVLPSSRTEMAIVGPLVKNELLLFTLTLALALGWMLLGAGRATPATGTGATGPEARLARAAAARDRAWRRSLSLLGLTVVALLGTAFVTRARVPGPAPATPLVASDGRVDFDAADLAGGTLRFYEVALPSGEPVRFFALQYDGVTYTDLDACEICGPIGYFRDGNAIVCRNCTSPIAPTSLGRGGGCNPIPVPHRLEGGRVTIAVADLEAAFPRAKGR
jgi:high-affinity iron transporter